MQEHISPLKDMAYLAERLGLSVSTVERLRLKGSKDIPPHLTIGKSIRYDIATVEKWLAGKLQLNNIQMEVPHVA